MELSAINPLITYAMSPYNAAGRRLAGNGVLLFCFSRFFRRLLGLPLFPRLAGSGVLAREPNVFDGRVRYHELVVATGHHHLDPGRAIGMRALRIAIAHEPDDLRAVVEIEGNIAPVVESFVDEGREIAHGKNRVVATHLRSQLRPNHLRACEFFLLLRRTGTRAAT